MRKQRGRKRLRIEEEKLKREGEERNRLQEMKIKAEEVERQKRLEFEEMKMKADEEERRTRMQQEFELERERIRLQAENDRVRGEIVANDQHGNGENREVNYKKRFVIDIGKWKPEETDLNTFLCRFETCATAMEVEGKMKALELTRCLEGSALELVQTL